MATHEMVARPWERPEDESAQAYEAFLAYRDLGQSRTFKATADRVGKHESLMRRWAYRHRWRERVWAWDLHEARQDEAAVRQQRDEMLQQHLDGVGRMGRACLLYFRTLVRRDPETQEISFTPQFTPSVALRFLEVALKAQGAFAPSNRRDEPENGPRSAEADLFQLADGELEELISLARERAQQQEIQEEEQHDIDQDNTQQSSEEDVEREEEAEGKGEQDSQ